MSSLTPLPAQPAGVAWPTGDWPHGPPGDDVDGGRLDALVEEATRPGRHPLLGRTDALLVVHGGRLVTESYGAGIDAGTTLPSWSVTKSILHAVVGTLVGRGMVDPSAPAGLAEWSDPDDARGSITLDDLLHMRSGLAWVEDYVDGESSDVIRMLFGQDRRDVAAYAAHRPLGAPVGSTFCYSSGTSNLVSYMIRDLVGGPDPCRELLRGRLFDPLGMRSPIPKFDAAGTWIASSYCFATARDLARLGLLYLRDGVWEDRRLLPAGWVDHARAAQPDVDDEGWGYGAHWWTLHGRDDGLFLASGYRGKYVVVVPALDLVVVRSGDSETEQRDSNVAMLCDVVSCFGG